MLPVESLWIPREACTEIVRRIDEYCRTLPDATLRVVVLADTTFTVRLRICEAAIKPPPWKGDDALPDSIRNILDTMDPAQRMEFLPVEGHFLLDVTVTASSMPQQPSAVRVEVEAYQHSAYGKKIVEKIKSQLQGEINRTNRKWRRKLQREQQQQQQDSSMDES